MTFGTFAEQRYFIYPDVNTYDGIIINGNMATHAPDGMAAFLIEKTRPKMPYIIDPLTHAFQHDPSHITSSKKDGTLDIKGPIKNLSEKFGEPIKSLVGSRPVNSKDLESDDILKEFVYNVLKFQKEQLSSRMAGSDVNKKYLEHTEAELVPYALISPYFYMTESSYARWLPIMQRSLQFAKSFDEFSSCKIFTSIVVSQGVILDNEIITSICEAMGDSPSDGFLFWIDGLSEHSAGGHELKGLLNLSSGLRKNNSRELINLHGGYFSIMAAGGKFGKQYFTGVAHGPEFGETRPVIPVGGGIPIAKYYVKSLHSRIKYNDTVAFFKAKGWLESSEVFHQKICNCLECQTVLSGDVDNFSLYGLTDSKPVKRGNGFVTIDYPTKETKEHCLRHYLQIKKWEYDFAANASKEEIIEDLNQGLFQFQDITGIEYLTYIDLWRKVLLSHENN